MTKWKNEDLKVETYHTKSFFHFVIEFPQNFIFVYIFHFLIQTSFFLCREPPVKWHSFLYISCRDRFTLLWCSSKGRILSVLLGYCSRMRSPLQHFHLHILNEISNDYDLVRKLQTMNSTFLYLLKWIPN